MLEITRTSPFSGKKNTMRLNISTQQYNAWKNGALIQNVMPHLTPDEREFLISGIMPDEWDEMFGDA